MRKIPVTIPYFDDREKKAVAKVLESGWVAQGPVVAEFERTVAEHEKVKCGVAVTSCTTALHLVMAALGLQRGMDVLVPAFTFVATANAVVQTGAEPVFVDVNETTFNIDIKKLEETIKTHYEENDGKFYNKNTGNLLWGIVPVHEFGLCCEIHEVNAIASLYNLHVIEDGACALGAGLGDAHVGGFGNPACISFHPRKSITTGEGGMILTDDDELACKMKALRSHGTSVSAEQRHQGKGFLLPEFSDAGYNYRMTDIQAAVGLEQMKKFDFIIREKTRKAAVYDELIKEKLPEFITPFIPEGYRHTYQSYVCMLDCVKLGLVSIEQGGKFRNYLLAVLEEAGIATRQGTHAVHMLGYYRDRFGFLPEDYPAAYACDHLSITLPLFVQMTEDEQRYVVEKIKDVIVRMKQGEEKWYQ